MYGFPYGAVHTFFISTGHLPYRHTKRRATIKKDLYLHERNDMVKVFILVPPTGFGAGLRGGELNNGFKSIMR